MPKHNLIGVSKSRSTVVRSLRVRLLTEHPVTVAFGKYF